MKKIVLITGAARGIGAAIANALQPQADILVLLDKDAFALSHQTNDKNNVKNFFTDLSDAVQVQNFINKLIRESIYPNIIINNAGFGGDFQTVDKVSTEMWDQIFNINVKAQFLLAKAFLPNMRKNNYGKIINIASVQGFLGAPNSSVYVASKHAALGLMKTLAAEWGSFGITCNAISPGYVNTKMGIQDTEITNHDEKILSRTPIKRIAEPTEIASLVKYLLSEDASFINGENIVIDGGLTCHVGTQ